VSIRALFGRWCRVVLPVAAAGALVAVPGLSQAASQPGWRIVSVLRENASLPNGTDLTGVAATGSANAWLVGTDCSNSNCNRSTLLVRHWTGKAWQVIAAPKAYRNSTTEFEAAGVAASSAASAWVLNNVGTYQNYSTTVLHWTGKGWGPSVKFPAMLTAAVAPLTKRAWVFGTDATASPYAATFNGTKWASVTVPVAGIRASATTASNIWVIGAQPSVGAQQFGIMKYNGKAWHTIPVPSLGLSSSEQAFGTDIAAVSTKNVWAAGYVLDTASEQIDPPSKPFLLHWNGTKWTAIKVPNLPVGSMWPNVSVTQDGHGGTWLDATTISLSGAQQGYLLHYNGGAWARATAPALSGDFTEPGALAWIPGTRSVWGTGEDSLVEPNLNGSPAVVLKYGA
jgi:hypothetical protein